MPIIALTLVVAVVLGLSARPTVALVGTGACCLVATAVFIRAITDGHGNDPAWLIAVPLAVTPVSLWVTRHLATARRQRRSGIQA